MKGISRRTFLQTLVVTPVAFSLLDCSSDYTTPLTATRVFFTAHEAAFVDAATARMIPADELGPGANEADVTRFLDLQLAGAYGRAYRWYMRGPWDEGTKQQGYQSPLTPAKLYRAAIAEIDLRTQHQYDKRFAALSPERQDAILHALEEGSFGLQTVPEKMFLNLLWQNTKEGFLADPVYAGNRDFAGWKLIGFPGPRYNYVDEIGDYGKPYRKPYVSLAGRAPQTHSKRS